MNLDYRRDIHRQIMIAAPDRDSFEYSYRLKMILNNSIPGFLSCTFESMNGIPMIYYDITGLKPLSLYLEENRADVLFIRQFTTALLSGFDALGKYFLDAEYILLTSRTVFMDPGTKEVKLVCFPFEKKSLDESLCSLAGFILSRASGEPEDIKAAYRFYSACSTGSVTSDSLKEVLRSLKEEEPVSLPEAEIQEEEIPFFADERSEKRVNKRTANKEGSIIRRFTESIKRRRAGNEQKGQKGQKGQEYGPDHGRHSPGKKDTVWKKYERPVPESRYRAPYTEEGFGDTVVLENGPGYAKEEAGAWLVPADVFSGESIELKGNECTIGRGGMPGVIDTGVKAVSRRHASIIRTGGTYAIADLCSRNGTYVNGRRLVPNEKVILSDGDTIEFANTAYYFCLTDKRPLTYTRSATEK